LVESPELYSSEDIIEYVVELDKQAFRSRAEVNDLLAPIGLHFDRPPSKLFEETAHERSGVAACRIVNTNRLVRIMYCTVANRHIRSLLDPRTADMPENQAATTALRDLLDVFERAIRSEADLILASIPFYLDPTAAGEGLSLTSVFPLVWPLSMLGTVPAVTPAQQAIAKEALFQIGVRAKAPIATKMANTLFHPGARLPEDAHLLHFM
jgi:hypothetical protein